MLKFIKNNINGIKIGPTNSNKNNETLLSPQQKEEKKVYDSLT